MKKVYYLLAVNLFFSASQAQDFRWAKVEGKYAYDYGYGITTDNTGNVYVAGKYEESGAHFSGTDVTCSGNHDIFLAKYTAGGELTWVRTGGGADGDYAEAVYCDGSNVFISGEIEQSSGDGAISFQGSPITLNVAWDNDVFFAKYDLSGSLLWAKSFGSDNSEKALGITADNSGNVYITGYYTSTTTVNGSNIIGWGGRDFYLAKYDKDGNFQWMKRAGSPTRDEGKFLKCDASGNIYVCGWMSKGIVFESQTLATYNNTNYADVFLAKYAPDGSLIWVKQGGGDWNDVAWGLTMDNAGTVYVAGEYDGYAEFGSFHTTTTGASDIFVVAYNSSGDVVWGRSAGSTKFDRARGIGTDGSYIFITGQVGEGVSTFGDHQVTGLDTSDIFIAGLKGNGEWIFAETVKGAKDAYEDLGYESGNAVTGFAGGNVYATGGLLNGGDFGPIYKTGYTRDDVFVTKLTFDPASVALNERAVQEGFGLYPNPSSGRFILSFQGFKDQVPVNVYDCLGKKLITQSCRAAESAQLDLSAYPEGVYMVEAGNGDNKVHRKLIVQH